MCPQVGDPEPVGGSLPPQHVVDPSGLALEDPARHGRHHRSGRQGGAQVDGVHGPLRLPGAQGVVAADDRGDEVRTKGPARRPLHVDDLPRAGP